MSENRKPIAVFKTGLSSGLQIAAWGSSQGGNTSFTITKRYKDKGTGEWKESKSLFVSDLAALAHLAPAAIQFADDLYQKEKGERGSEPVSAPINQDEIPF